MILPRTLADSIIKKATPMSTTTYQDILDEEITPSVDITLGKKTYKLALSMASILAYKQKTGRNIFTPEGWKKFSVREDPESVIAFFWAALQTYHPELTFEHVTRMANFKNMGQISRKCNETLEVFMPPKPEGAEENPQTEPTK